MQSQPRIPALAATAWYHHKLPDQWKNRETLLREVEKFAGTDYLVALFQGDNLLVALFYGDNLSKAEQERIAEQLSRYTGLSK